MAATGLMDDDLFPTLAAACRAVERGKPVPVRSIDEMEVEDPEGLYAARSTLLAMVERKGDAAGAISLLKMLVGVHPDETELVAMLADRQAKAGEIRSALKTVERGGVGDPDNPTLQTMRLGLLVRMGQVSKAAMLVRTRLESAIADTAMLELAMRALSNANDGRGAYALYQRFAHLGNDSIDASAMQMASRIENDEKAIDIALESDRAGRAGGAVFYRHARLLLDRQKVDEALEIVRLGLDDSPTDGQLKLALGEALLAKGLVRKAIESLEEAVDRLPDSARAHKLLARALRAKDKLREAAAAYGRAAALLPADETTTRQYVAALRAAGDEERATFVMDRLSGHLQNTAMTVERLLDPELREGEAESPSRSRLDAVWEVAKHSFSDRVAWDRDARLGHAIDQRLMRFRDAFPDDRDELGTLHSGGDTLAAIDELAQQGPLVLVTAHVGAASVIDLGLRKAGGAITALSPFVRADKEEPLHYCTAEWSDALLARTGLDVLGGGGSLLMFPDSASDPTAPRVELAGRSVPYQSVAARLAHLTNARCLFVRNYVDGATLRLESEPLPSPAGGQSLESYTTIFRDAYLEILAALFAEPPERLRLAGGLWQAFR